MVRLGLSREVARRRWRKSGETETVVPRLGRIRLGEFGVTVRGSTQRLDQPVSALAKFSEHIESGLGVPSCSIRKTGPGLFTMDLLHTDPLAEVIRVGDLPPPRRHLHVVTARAADGSGVEQSLPPLHLAVGATRSGKSQYAFTLIKQILDAEIPLRLRVFAKEQEFTALRDVAYDFETDPARWPAMLARVHSAMRSRQASLAKRGISELRHFTERDPLDLLILDEFLSVLAMRNVDVKTKAGTMKAQSVLNLLASQMLAAGFGMVAAAQLGQKDVIGSVRDLFPTASIFRVPPQADDMVDAVLGNGAKHLYPAQEIPVGRHTAGQGYTRTPSGVVLRTRVAYLDDDERADLVEQVEAETLLFGGSYRSKRDGAKQQDETHEKAGAAA